MISYIFPILLVYSWQLGNETKDEMRHTQTLFGVAVVYDKLGNKTWNLDLQNMDYKKVEGEDGNMEHGQFINKNKKDIKISFQIN